MLSGKKVYIAAAEVRDEEMRERVILHKKRREGLGFMTIERPRNLGGVIIPEDSCLLIESLSVLLANEMFIEGGVDFSAGGKVWADFLALRGRARHIVIVSDDVFSDGRSYDTLTELWRKSLGELHVRVAGLADEVIEVVSGCPVSYRPAFRDLDAELWR